MNLSAAINPRHVRLDRGNSTDPFFTPDGSALYFISTRSTDGVKKKDLDIWRVQRDARDQWSTPLRLPGPVNSSGQEWFPRLSKDGWLYFGSSREGGFGKTDIYRKARRALGGREPRSAYQHRRRRI